MTTSAAVIVLIGIDALLVIAAFGYLFISQREIRRLHKECEKTIVPEIAEEKNYVERVAVRQMQMVEKFNELVLAQAQKSFMFAVIYSVAGILFFFTFMLVRQPQDPPTISAVGSIVLELIAGANLYLYGRAAHQMAICHARLFKTQDFLLSISVCKTLSKGEETCAKIALIIADYSDNTTHRRTYKKRSKEKVGGLSANGSHPQVEHTNVAV